MSNKKSFFLTGANARILLNNKTVAFATDIQYTIDVRHASPRVLGRFEVEVHQPLSYDVSGSMTIIRYARGIKDFLGGSAPEDASNAGNGMGSYKLGSALGAIGSSLGLPTTDGIFDGAADEAFVPERFFQSKMFNIEIRQKLPKAADGFNPFSIQDAVNTIDDLLLPDALAPSATRPEDNETTVILLRDCRIERLSFSLNKRGVATQTLTFRARYADDDTAIARKSGVGQQLS